MTAEPHTSEDFDAGSGEGTTLSLSGGGYRAMVFHVGALCRLNEVGLLSKLKRVSSVSGGSIRPAFSPSPGSLFPAVTDRRSDGMPDWQEKISLRGCSVAQASSIL